MPLRSTHKKFNDDGWPICMQDGCELPATMYTAWADKECLYCLPHLGKLQSIANARGMGASVAASTRLLPPDFAENLKAQNHMADLAEAMVKVTAEEWYGLGISELERLQIILAQD